MCESNGAGSFSLGCNPHHVIWWLLAVKLAEQCDQVQMPLRFPDLLGDPNTMASNRECRASGFMDSKMARQSARGAGRGLVHTVDFLAYWLQSRTVVHKIS